jgi:hypothetical protein
MTMPYDSKEQRQFFLACAHGWSPGGKKKCPPSDVISRWEKEFASTKKSCGGKKKKKKFLPLD